MRVFLDTNILVSALIVSGSPPGRLYEAWREGRFELLTSRAQLEEFQRVTRYPRLRQHIQPAEAGTMCNEVGQLANLVATSPPVDVSPDPADNYLLSMAETGKADYLVTGDSSVLLALGRHESTRIVTARKMVRVLKL